VAAPELTRVTLTRFAPSPTGALHLGHVANAVFVWGLGQALGARVLLRIEDHDRERSRPEYERDILDDLDWLGLVPDRFPTSDFRQGPCASRQSDRDEVYAGHTARLVATGRVYGCVCSRQQLTAARTSAMDTALNYPGTCRERRIALTDGVAWRVRLDDVPTDPFEELLTPSSVPDRAGDPVIRDRRGCWTYQFAVSVDDFEQGVDLVIRGRDIQESTPLQVRLARLLGRTAPARFAHHPLIMKSSKAKLSKSDGDSGIRELRRAGWSPGQVLGQAARLAGISASQEPIDPADLPLLFPAARHATGANL
jgi:glutamyl/glutaminyl-tRNA synthetase